MFKNLSDFNITKFKNRKTLVIEVFIAATVWNNIAWLFCLLHLSSFSSSLYQSEKSTLQFGYFAKLTLPFSQFHFPKLQSPNCPTVKSMLPFLHSQVATLHIAIWPFHYFAKLPKSTYPVDHLNELQAA